VKTCTDAESKISAGKPGWKRRLLRGGQVLLRLRMRGQGEGLMRGDKESGNEAGADDQRYCGGFRGNVYRNVSS